MGIFNFNNFSILNEKAGVAEATLFYIDPIFNKTWEEFRSFLSSGEKKYSDILTLNYRSFNKKITDNKIYSEFPVVSISLSLEFKKLSNTLFNKKYNKLGKPTRKHTIGGYSTRFGNKNWTGYSKSTTPVKSVTDHGIIIEIGVDIDVREDFNIGSFWKKTTDDIHETIWHELNHSYEHYKRFISGVGPIWKRAPRLAMTHASINKWNLSKHIYDFWTDKFILYLYTSESQEINAQVQETAYYIKKYGMKSLVKTKGWETANLMIDFNAVEFINQLEEVILEDNNDIEQMKKSLKDMWIAQYRNFIKDSKEDHSIDDKLMERLDFKSFVELMGKKINRGGNKLKKKLIKLYQHDPSQNT